MAVVLVGILLVAAAAGAIIFLVLPGVKNLCTASSCIGQVFNSYQFDSTGSNFGTFNGYSCTYQNGLNSPPGWCPGSGSFTYGSTGISSGQSVTATVGQAGAFYDQQAAGTCSGGFPVCGFAQAVQGAIPNQPSTYGLSLGMSASNWQVLGTPANANWQNQFQESIPTATAGSCPFTLIAPACNPYTVVLGTGNSSIAYNIYRFTFLITLQTTGDKLTTAAGGCVVATFGNSGLCTQQEVNALNSAFSFINSGNTIKGTVQADISVPDPFYYSSFGTAVADQYGIVGAWIAGTNGCNLSTVQFGTTLTVTPCQSHTVISNKLASFTVASNEPSLSSYSGSTLPTSSLNPNAQFVFTVNKLQTQYKAVACTSISGSNCPGSASRDCLASGDCVIQSDSGVLLQIPLVLDVIGSGPNLQQQAKNIGLISSTTTTTYNPLTGNIQVHVQDSLLGLPITGIPVNYGSGSACSTANYYGTTDGSGNVKIIGLSVGPYSVCSTGQSGYVTLIFIQIQGLFSLAQSQVPGGVTGGGTATVTLVLQDSINVSLTLAGILGVIGAGIVIVVIVIIAASLGTGIPGIIRAVQTSRQRSNNK